MQLADGVLPLSGSIEATIRLEVVRKQHQIRGDFSQQATNFAPRITRSARCLLRLNCGHPFLPPMQTLPCYKPTMSSDPRWGSRVVVYAWRTLDGNRATYEIEYSSRPRFIDARLKSSPRFKDHCFLRSMVPGRTTCLEVAL